MKLNTTELQKIIPILRNTMGHDMNKPMTTFLGIKTTADSIVFYTLGRDNVKASIKVENPDPNVDIAIMADTFMSLIDMTTTETIELTLDDVNKCLKFKGNGSYSFSKMISESGDIKFTDINLTNLPASLGQLSKEVLKSIDKYNSVATAEQDLDGNLSTYNYHLRPLTVLTGIPSVFCNNKMTSGISVNVSVQPNTLKSLIIMSEAEDINVYDIGADYYFITSNTILKSPKIASANTFPGDMLLDSIKDENFNESTVILDKKSVIESINRLNLFNDTGKINLNLHLDAAAITLSIKNENEVINYNSGAGKAFDILVNTALFRGIISSISEDNFTIKYKTDTKDMIKITSNDVEYLLSSVED